MFSDVAVITTLSHVPTSKSATTLLSLACLPVGDATAMHSSPPASSKCTAELVSELHPTASTVPNTRMGVPLPRGVYPLPGSKSHESEGVSATTPTFRPTQCRNVVIPLDVASIET